MLQSTINEALEQIIDRSIKNVPLVNGNLSNEDISVLYNLAKGLYQSGDYKKSKEIFQHLTLNQPNETKHWQGLAAVLQMEKNYQNALTAWSMLTLFLEDDPMPHFHAADCLYMLDRIPEALTALDEAEKLLNGSENDIELKEKIGILKSQWSDHERS